ncbi:hypothetical protein VPH35_009727 [Triticum aestivum]
MDKKIEVRTESKEGLLRSISCSCHKLECTSTPCSHIFYILGILQEEALPRCCVPTRWTMSAKCAFASTRKSEMYAYSAALQRYRKLRNCSHAACFKACHSDEAFKHLERVLEGQDVCKGSTSEQADSKGSTNAQGNNIRFGPLMPQSANLDGEGFEKVLDPVHVPARGASKKRLHAKMKKTRTKGRCSYCHEADGHNRRSQSRSMIATTLCARSESKYVDDQPDVGVCIVVYV